MKGLRILVMLALVFVVSAPLFAAPPVQQEDTSALEYASSGGSEFCTDTWGCPNCVANMDGTNSLCAKIRYATGRCVCANPKPPTATRAICGTYCGSCKFIW
jgi:hypothetical protein